ncbi:uncharacterized protein isoform X2 [Choristoneura fumiferana]
MRRISPNNPVRRRLFADADLSEEARIDNCTNVLQESIARDKAEMSKKWNFDFDTETPLDGPIEWFKREGENWVGWEKNTDICDEKDSFQMKMENEVTPNEKTAKDPPVVRKRRNDSASSDKGVRRKISFD